MSHQIPCGEAHIYLQRQSRHVGERMRRRKRKRRRKRRKLTTACREGVVNLLHNICQVRAAVVGI